MEAHNVNDCALVFCDGDGCSCASLARYGRLEPSQFDGEDSRDLQYGHTVLGSLQV